MGAAWMITLERLKALRSTGWRYAWTRFREDRAAGKKDDWRRADYYSELWRRAAVDVGAEVSELSPGRILELRRAGRRIRVWHYRVGIDDAVALEIAGDKTASSRLLGAAGLPVTSHVEFTPATAQSALDFLRDHAPCVIKPASGTGAGAGVTTGVKGRRDLSRATRRAARHSSRLVIERQVPGDVYRMLVLDGEVIDVLRRLPPRVVGDGHSSIRELVFAENRRRLEAGASAALRIVELDLDALLTLRSAGLSPRSVPPAGTAVTLKTVTNQSRLEDNHTVRGPLADELAAEVVAAADVLGLRLAGVDVVCTDLERSLSESGGAIIEVNGTPGLHHHYNVADASRATPVATEILRRLLP